MINKIKKFKFPSDKEYALAIITAFEEGKLPYIACYENDEFTVTITEPVSKFVQGDHQKGIIIYSRTQNNETAWCGMWMDFPEEHWKMSEDVYYDLPREARAFLEAEEQANTWATEALFQRLSKRHTKSL